MTLEEEVVALRRQVRELTEELDEYRRQNRPSADGVRRAQWHHAAERLGICRPAARVVLALTERPGLICTSDMLRRAIVDDAEEKSEAIVRVAVCYARKPLARYGVKIKNIWGVGYSISVADAKRLKTLLGEGPVLAHA